MSAPTGIERIRQAWRKRSAGALGLALSALAVSVFLATAHLARIGTVTARAATVAILVALLSAYVVIVWLDRRGWRSARRTIARVLLRTDNALGARTLRALRLVDRTDKDEQAGSAELAQLHFERLLQRASVDAIEAAASRHAQRWRGAALALALIAACISIASPMRIVEGYDVLAARDGRAPLTMSFLRYARVSAQPPSYTRQPERSLVFGSMVDLPKGTVLTVRGVARYEQRALVVTDGKREVPFVSDGAGGLVSRFTIQDTGEVRVAARYGEVLIDEPDPLQVEAVRDTPPIVQLEGAPRTLRLSELERIEIRWTAQDDHGLREVDLVLRSGAREDRRVLERFDGESKLERGGHVLKVRDAFLRRMFLPVTISVEAKDNDPLDGPKWGASSPIIVLPPVVGEPEADRYKAFLALRGAFVDLLAWSRDTTALTDAAERRSREAEIPKRTQDLVQHTEEVLDGNYGGLAVARGMKSFALGQVRSLQSAQVDSRQLSARMEEVLLGIDAALGSLGARDTETVAKRLGDVAEEVATGARLARESEKNAGARERLDLALAAVGQGAEELVALGALGRDVGSVAQSEVRRIRRAREANDLMHAELAALHLAARLRRPVPSFGAAGGGRGGVESGSGQRTSGDSAESASRAPSDFDQLADELAQLAREHSDSVSSVERALDEAAQQEQLEALRQEAKERANAIRQAVDDLPPPGEIPGSRRASEALAREHATAMAHDLEKLDLKDALESGDNAKSSLSDAKQRPGEGSVTDEELDATRRTIQEQLDWAKQAYERLRQQAEAKAHAALEKAGDQEQSYAERAEKLNERGKNPEASLPEDIAERLERAQSVMQEAARQLREGQGERGLSLQREAQRLLEQSGTGKTTDEEDEQKSQSSHDSEGKGHGREIATGGEVPNADARKSAEEFRQRVLRGLAERKSERLSPSIKRYAEGLLQ